MKTIETKYKVGRYDGTFYHYRTKDGKYFFDEFTAYKHENSLLKAEANGQEMSKIHEDINDTLDKIKELLDKKPEPLGFKVSSLTEEGAKEFNRKMAESMKSEIFGLFDEPNKEPKFKIGDKVKSLNSGLVGPILKVEKLVSERKHDYLVSFPGYTAGWVPENCLVLAPDEKASRFKVGEVVYCEPVKKYGEITEVLDENWHFIKFFDGPCSFIYYKTSLKKINIEE